MPLIRRLLSAVFALWALGSLVFLLSHRSPLAADDLLLPDATELSSTSDPVVAQAARQALRQRLGLDRPLFYLGRAAPDQGPPGWRWHGTRNQYHRWLSALLRGDLGHSLRTGQPVTDRLGTALRCTLPLTATALALVLGAALLLGPWLAGGAGWAHGAVRTGLLALHSVPLFLLALGLLLLLANPAVLAWFPAYGSGVEGDDGLGPGARLGQQALHLVLPVASLVLAALPDLALQLEAALRHELHSGYATTGRAKGLPASLLLRRHALPNALLPLLTQLTELLPALVAGALVVEVVFALPGMGRLLVEAAAQRDYPVLLAGVLLAGAVRFGALLLADISYAWADPRIAWNR